MRREYFTYITVSIPIYVFGQAINPIIRSDGSPRFAMVSMLAGAIANCILDPHRHLCAALGRDGRGCGDGGRAGDHGRDGRVVPLPYEGAAAGERTISSSAGRSSRPTCRWDCAAFLRRSRSSSPWRRPTTCSCSTVRAASTARTSADGPRHRHEGVSDHHFHHHRHVRGLHPHCGLQLRRGAIRPAAAGSCGG